MAHDRWKITTKSNLQECLAELAVKNMHCLLKVKPHNCKDFILLLKSFFTSCNRDKTFNTKCLQRKNSTFIILFPFPFQLNTVPLIVIYFFAFLINLLILSCCCKSCCGCGRNKSGIRGIHLCFYPSHCEHTSL